MSVKRFLLFIQKWIECCSALSRIPLRTEAFILPAVGNVGWWALTSEVSPGIAFAWSKCIAQRYIMSGQCRSTKTSSRVSLKDHSSSRAPHRIGRGHCCSYVEDWFLLPNAASLTFVQVLFQEHSLLHINLRDCLPGNLIYDILQLHDMWGRNILTTLTDIREVSETRIELHAVKWHATTSLHCFCPQMDL